MTVKIADLKNNLSRHLARVRRGGEITVYDRDAPIARIVPFVPGNAHDGRDRKDGGARVDDREDPARDRIAELVRAGVLSPGAPEAVAGWLGSHPPLRTPAGTPSIVQLLLEERRSSTR